MKLKCDLCDSDEHILLNCLVLKDENVDKTFREKKICVRCLCDPFKGYDRGTFYSKFHERQVSSDWKTCRAKDTGNLLVLKFAGVGRNPNSPQLSTVTA